MSGKRSGVRYLVGFSLAFFIVVLIFSLRYWQERSSERTISDSGIGNPDVPIVLKEFNDYQ